MKTFIWKDFIKAKGVSLKWVIKENMLDYVLEVMKRNKTLGQAVLHVSEVSTPLD